MFVIKKATAVISNYCNLRSNDLAADFQPNPHVCQLVFVYIGLVKCSKDELKSQEAIMKLCHSRKVPQDEISAVTKICQWGETALIKLSAVLEKYQNYGTSDPKEKGEKIAIRRRQAKKMNKSLFKAFSKVPEEVFLENCEQVLGNTLSFKDLVNLNESHLILKKTERNAVIAAGVDSTEELKKRFPKFDEEALKNFLGAEVYGKKANKQGENLSNYIKALKGGADYKIPLEINECEKVWDIGAEVIDGFDILIFETEKIPQEYIEFLINHIGSSFQLFCIWH